MKLKTYIGPPLWLAISDSYQAKNYNHAISDAMKYLTELLRKKSGEDKDGARLVDATLGGKSPRLKINRFQTESERNIQEGFFHLLRGLYQGIRNPRAHERKHDTKEDADAIIHFIDYLARTLEASKGPFSAHDFVEAILNDDFYPEGSYAELLADEIPEDKRLVTLFELYQAAPADILKIGPICREIYKYLNAAELSEFMAAVSSELGEFVIAYEDVSISSEWDIDNAILVHLRLLSPTIWPRISKRTKWRVESIVLEILESGTAYSPSDSGASDETGLVSLLLQFTEDEGAQEFAYIPTDSGAPGIIGYKGMLFDSESFTATFANEYLEYFEDDNKEKVQTAFLKDLKSLDFNKTLYIFRFFLPYLPTLVGNNKARKEDFTKLIANAVNRNQSGYALSSLPNTLQQLPADWAEPLKELLPFLNQGSDDRLS